MTILSELDKKNVDMEKIAKKTLKDKRLISDLLEGVLSKKDEIRFNSHNVLMLISKKHPEMIYNRWDFFEDLLNSDNNYQKYIAIHIIANLAEFDTENKFEKIFERYYNILAGNGTMVAGHLVGNSGKIAKAKPKLQTKITNKLLNIDDIHQGKQKELIKAYAIEAFDEYFNESKNKKEILEFVNKQLKSESPKTRKKAEEFLKKWKIN